MTSPDREGGGSARFRIDQELIQIRTSRMKRKSTKSWSRCIAAMYLSSMVWLATDPVAWAQTPDHRVSVADQAIQSARSAASADTPERDQAEPNSYEEIYNNAVADYRQGQFSQAKELFKQSLATPNKTLEAKARFNLANCDYAVAIAQTDQDPQTTIALLKNAISHYRGALELNPEDTDARANIELATKLIDQMKNPQQRKQQQQKQDPQNQKNSQTQDQPKTPQDPKQNSQDQDSDPQKNQHEQNPQKQQKQKNESAPQQAPPQDPQTQDQPDTSQDPTQKQPDTPTTPTQGTPNDPTQSPPSSGEASQIPEGETQPITQEEAQKMLQSIRDRDLQRRIKKQLQASQQRTPVQQDW